MIDIILLSIRNIFRNARRTTITILSIVIGFVALACLGGFIQFSFEGLRESTIRSQIGHIQIYAEGYGERHVSNPEAVMIENSAALIDAITALPGVELVTPRLSFSGLGSAGHDVVNMSVIGVDLTKERIFSSFETVIDGRRLRSHDSDGGIVGEQLMQGLGASVGDWVTILTNSTEGVLNAVDFKIIGVVKTGSKEYDSVFVKIPIEQAQQVRETEGVERLIVLLHETDMLDAVRPQIETLLTERDFSYEILQWTDLASFYNAVERLYSGLFRVFSGIIGIVVMFAVANTMIMSVFERTNEIGVLRAIGMARLRLVTMFLLEGIWIGILGSVIGAGASWGISYGLDIVGGFPMPPPPGSTEGFQAYLIITPKTYVLAFVVVFFATLLSSLYPALVASRVKIVEALHSS
jgi:putative ABC transport system permease protein